MEEKIAYVSIIGINGGVQKQCDIAKKTPKHKKQTNKKQQKKNKKQKQKKQKNKQKTKKTKKEKKPESIYVKVKRAIKRVHSKGHDIYIPAIYNRNISVFPFMKNLSEFVTRGCSNECYFRYNAYVMNLSGAVGVALPETEYLLKVVFVIALKSDTKLLCHWAKDTTYNASSQVIESMG